jgi:hypothetical protein
MMWPKYKNDASSVWLFPTVFLSILQYISANLTAEECRSLGFTPNLLCSTCDELPQFKLESLVENCNGCCQADQNETAVEKVCLKQLVMEIRSVGSVVDVCVFCCINLAYIINKIFVLKTSNSRNSPPPPPGMVY